MTLHSRAGGAGSEERAGPGAPRWRRAGARRGELRCHWNTCRPGVPARPRPPPAARPPPTPAPSSAGPRPQRRAPPRPAPSANKTRPSGAQPPEPRRGGRPEAAPLPAPSARGVPGDMEPGPRRRRTCRPPVSAFLRDPSSGRVYRRGKLIGKVRTRLRESAGGSPAAGRGVRARSRAPASSVRPEAGLLRARVCVSARLWGLVSAGAVGRPDLCSARRTVYLVRREPVFGALRCCASRGVGAHSRVTGIRPL